MTHSTEAMTVKRLNLLQNPGAHDWGRKPSGQLMRGWGYPLGYHYTYSLQIFYCIITITQKYSFILL